MHVRRALARLMQQQPSVRTVSVPSCSPTSTAINSTSSLSETTPTHTFMEEFLSDEMIPSPPVLDEVRLTVGATKKVVRNKKKLDKWYSASLKVATKMFHNKGEPGGPSAKEIQQMVRKQFDGTGPSDRTIVRYVNEYKFQRKGLPQR